MRNLLVLFTLVLAIAGCTRLTAENYAKVKVGMSYSEVTSILGTPASCNEAAGVKSCRWGDDKSHATVHFAGEKVMLHSAENIR
jgi:hypothetical protein